MSFLDDGATVLPAVKSDVRPASIPIAVDEWAAGDSNQVRQALLDIRTYLLTQIWGSINITAGANWDFGSTNNVAEVSGNMVIWHFEVTATGAASWVGFATLPNGSWPVVETIIPCRVYDANLNIHYSAFLVIHETDGTVDLQYIDNGSAQVNADLVFTPNLNSFIRGTAVFLRA